MVFPDHPLTFALEKIRSDKPIRTAKEALALVDALKYQDGILDKTRVGAYDRLITFLSSKRKLHRVNCEHLELKRTGHLYRCVQCKLVVVEES